MSCRPVLPPIDLVKTLEVVDVLESQGKLYGVLLTRVVPRMLSARRIVMTLADVSLFDTCIPKREGVVNMFGKPFEREFFGYDRVFTELVDVLTE